MVSHSTEMLQALLARNPTYGLPGWFFHDPDVLLTELEQIYYKEWLFVGHSCEIATPGEFVTLKIGAYPLVIVRGQDGMARCFHNVCRHRGQIVCTTPKGAAGKLVCPYHQWTYELDGRLLHARDMMSQIDRAKFGLKQAHCEELAGYIFVSLADEPTPFSAFRQLAEPYMAPHKVADAKVAFRSTIIEKGNWKLVMENNRECYHCRVNHPELKRVYSDAPTMTGVQGVEDNKALTDHWSRCEAMGLPSTFQIAPSGQFRVVRMPFIDNQSSMTMDGTPASTKLLSDFQTTALGSMMFFHYPNTWNHLMADHTSSFRVLPLSTGETELTSTWLVHKDAVEGVDYDLRKLTEVWVATNEEDQRLVETNQAGVTSPAFEPGPYSEMHEDGVMQFVDWYSHLMIPRLRGDSARLAS